MSCQQVETWPGDLARGRVTDAGVCAETERHLAACPHCTARLDEEKFMSAALHAVAAYDENSNAPAHVEAHLLAAFRAQAETQTNASATMDDRRWTMVKTWLWSIVHRLSSIVGSEATQSVADHFWPRYALTALAVAVVLVLLAVAALRSQLQPTQPQQTAGVSVPTNTAPSAPQPANANITSQQKVPEPRVVDYGDAAHHD